MIKKIILKILPPPRSECLRVPAGRLADLFPFAPFPPSPRPGWMLDLDAALSDLSQAEPPHGLAGIWKGAINAGANG